MFQHSCTTSWLRAALITQPEPLEGVWQFTCGQRINVQRAEHSCGAASPNLVPGYLTDPYVIFLIFLF